MPHTYNSEILLESHQLESEDYILEPISGEDVKLIYDIRSREDTMYYLGLEPYTKMDEAEAFVIDSVEARERKRGITFVIKNKTAGEAVGYFGYWRIFEQHARGEIGYAIHPEHRKKGVMGQVFPVVIDFGFNVLNLHSIYAETSDDNFGSMKLLLSNGFKQEGCFRESYFYRGEFIDSLFFGKIASEQ